MSLVPGAETVHDRESWQDPRYPVFGPLDNVDDNGTLAVHYTAADDLIDGDPGEHAEDLMDYMRSMNRHYWTRRGYALGYCWAVDWLGGIWQIRGWEYQSAANKGHNHYTIPVLVLVDGDDEATPEAVESVRLIRREAERRAGHPFLVKGHGQLRVETGVGTATSCPGRGLQRQVDAGVFYDPVAPPVEGDEEIVIAYIAKPPASRGPSAPWLVVINAAVRYATNEDTVLIPEHRTLNEEQYGWLLRSAGLD